MAQDSQNYQRRHTKTLKRIKTLYAENPSFNAVAEKLDGYYPRVPIWAEDIRRAVNDDYVRPAIVLAFTPPRKRCRLPNDIPEELRDAITTEARRLEITNGGMLELMWKQYRPIPTAADIEWAIKEVDEYLKETAKSTSPGKVHVRCPVCHENADWQDGYYCKNETCPNFVGATQ
jgi:hypothetical protein